MFSWFYLCRGLTDESEILKFLQHGTLVGLLPVPHPILLRKYQANRGTSMWFRTYMWGIIYLRFVFIHIFRNKCISFSRFVLFIETWNHQSGTIRPSNCLKSNVFNCLIYCPIYPRCIYCFVTVNFTVQVVIGQPCTCLTVLVSSRLF